MSNSTTTPKEISNTISEFCKTINLNNEPVYVDIIPEKDALPLECFPNVQKKILKDGGKIQYGWAIWEWPFILVEAEFHAVWVNPNGELIDITPSQDGEKRRLFLPDSSKTYTGERVESIRKALRDIHSIHDFIDNRIKINEIVSRGSLNRREVEEYNILIQKHNNVVKELKKIKMSRNELCTCGSGLKYKNCHGKS